MKKYSKKDRQMKLQVAIEENPFITDEQTCRKIWGQCANYPFR